MRKAKIRMGGTVVKNLLANAGDTREAGDWVQFLGREEEEKEMAIHSSILALEIPWAEEPYD